MLVFRGSLWRREFVESSAVLDRTIGTRWYCRESPIRNEFATVLRSAS
jgi:hypothetical protein